MGMMLFQLSCGLNNLSKKKTILYCYIKKQGVEDNIYGLLAVDFFKSRSVFKKGFFKKGFFKNLGKI